MKSPNYSTRYLAWTALHKQGAKATAALEKLWSTKGDDRLRARALWLLGNMDGQGQKYVELASKDENVGVRVTAVRLARSLKLDTIKLVQNLVNDADPAVRRECIIALRHSKAPEAAELWAELALKYDGKDRWYLEALGIGADKNWDAYLDAYLAKAGDKLMTDAGKDIVWRSRATKTPALLSKIIKDKSTAEESKPRFMRAFDFQAKGPEKDKALQELLILE
jgi:HEAT repeat protein